VRNEKERFLAALEMTKRFPPARLVGYPFIGNENPL
jgi:hypothetical protein